MTIFRLLESHELAEAARLSDSVFRPNAQPSMGQMFPRLFAPGISHSYGAFAPDGTLAAFMGLAPSTLRVGGAASLRAFSIGSVCTSTEHRGAGLAGRLLELCIAHAERAEAPLLFVSGDRSLYTRAGSAAFGRAASAVLRPAAAAVPPVRLRAAEPQDLLRLHALHAAGNTRFEESAAGLGELLGAAAYSGVLGLQQLVVLAEDENGLAAAYAVLGVPHPQPGKVSSASAADPIPAAPDPDSSPPTVIGYGGEAPYVARLLTALPLFCGLDELHVDIPWQDRELEALLERSGAKLQSATAGGTLLVTDVELLLEQACDFWPLPWQEALNVDSEGRVFAASSGRELSRTEWYGTLLDPNYPRVGDIPAWFEVIPLPNPYGLHYT